MRIRGCIFDWSLDVTLPSAKPWLVQPWTLLSRKTVLDRRWLRVSQDRVLLPNGTIIDEFHLLNSPAWSAVIAVTADAEVVMVEQYRHGLGATSLELPSGVIDDGEMPVDAARRELREETGFSVSQLQPLIELAPEPSRATHRAHFFFGTGASLDGCAQPEASEVIRVRLLPVARVFEAIDSGRIMHAAHVGAILFAQRRGWLST